jgi:hypothetical protein
MKFEIKIRLTHTEVKEFETAALAHAYATGRVEKSQGHAATLASIVQVDPPLVERPCPGCQPTPTPTPTPPPEIEIDLSPDAA